MFRQEFHIGGGPRMSSVFSYTPGLILVLLGVLVLLMPQLLVMFVSFSLISLGVTMLVMAGRWRSVMRPGQWTKQDPRSGTWEID
ncbi:MAG: hypothetical protein KDD62_16275 [Bdellovibrionales bacterium]|nr:hypothetical protein [Bdellovibrionales bacterium]